ncbi:nuclear transport factor 2 family protein [Methylobacterium aquaticum]|uniref:nuclear transport factor 2 family protein n=1 Tax=Methylobacterium aquaticum TaxID=270351 RepID=UPI0019322A89|nr:nuclear transport factor 2 family protein [Methylobacterium aquaticum]QRE74282.1 nuclear transport factor 2 family protein [Methylobacterium aquaticum]
MTDPAALAARYLATWNETDPTRRRALLAETFTEGARYRDPLMAGEGHDGLDALIGAVQARFPGLRFRLAGRPDGYGDHLRFSWALAPEGGDGVVEGTDFATLEGGRLAEVTGFLDRVPA